MTTMPPFIGHDDRRQFKSEASTQPTARGQMTAASADSEQCKTKNGRNVWVALTNAAALAGLLGAIAFVLLNTAATIVYRPLGVRPAEVGLTYSAMLAQSATGAAAILIIAMSLGVYVALVAGVYPWVRERVQPWLKAAREAETAKKGQADPERSRSDVRSFVRTVGGFLVVLFVGAVILYFVLSAALVIVPAIALLRVLTARSRDEVIERLGGRTVLVVILVLISALSAAALFLLASRDADRMKNGWRPSSIAGLPLPWDAEVAKVRWLGRPDAPKLPRCSLYLGQSEGTAVLFDTDLDHAFRVPASDVLLETRPETARC